MTLGRDTTADSIIWNPGEPFAKKGGEDVKAPKVASPEDAQEKENDKLIKAEQKTAKKVEKGAEKVANADLGAPADETPEAPPEETVEVDLEPEGSPPSPPEDLEANTNVETDAIKEDIEDAGPVPEASDIEINGSPTPVTGPNPEPGTVTQPPTIVDNP